MASPLSEEISPEDFGKRIQQYRPQVEVLNVETEQERFPRNGDHLAPETATWRCNLAALSQRRNLLFTANGAKIYVWIPKGSGQLLGSQPEMIIHPVMKEPDAPGYIDPTKPHTINHILVDDLGVDEVLLLATDSGNVTGYNVEAIFSAIDRCARFNYPRPLKGVEVKPFFAENVDLSAWGLATHKFARLIAVSSNTGLITVFAFAMVDEPSDVESTSGSFEASNLPNISESGQTWLSIDSPAELNELKKQMPNHRRRNLRLNYAGHFENIPCVSFANFDLDPNGTWMVSTDIFNRVIVWSVWNELSPVHSSVYGAPGSTPNQRGWFVLPVDPRRVQRHHFKIDACGCEPVEDMFEHRIFLNISDMIEHLTDWSPIMGMQAPKPPVICAPLPDDIFSTDCLVKPTQKKFSLAEHDTLSADTSPNGSANTDFDVDSDAWVTDDAESEHETETESDDTEVPALTRSLRVRRGIPDLFEEENEHLNPPPQHESKSPLSVTELELELQESYAFHPHNPQFFPVLHFSEHNITLASYPCDYDFQITAQSPLAQLRWGGGRIHDVCDRMNMIKYIPELGIVVAASQKGRVAIITLTWQEEIGHSFRIDWILPFSSQNLEFTHPRVPLMGMAVSPMPGFEFPQDIPCIPRNVNPKEWLHFDYRLLSPENDGPFSKDTPEHDPNAFDPFSNPQPKPKSPSAGQSDSVSPNISGPRVRNIYPTNMPSEEDDDDDDPVMTIPEIHAHASSIYQPHEDWHGWHPSRHYRLLLLFCNHSVVSYEFWHKWQN